MFSPMLIASVSFGVAAGTVFCAMAVLLAQVTGDRIIRTIAVMTAGGLLGLFTAILAMSPLTR